MVKSKEWDWNEADKSFWTKPCEESYYYANKWKKEGRKTILDLGCGLGRHSILFARDGFEVTAIDLSKDGIDYLNEWKKEAGLDILTKVCDMNQLPFPDNTFDCIWSYHVISHTDTEGFVKILDEIKRVLKPNGCIYFTLCSKDTWSYKEAGFPHIDQNTIMKTDGPEKGVPHYYVEIDDILELLGDFTIHRIRHIDDCYYAGSKQNSKHYYIEAILKQNQNNSNRGEIIDFTTITACGECCVGCKKKENNLCEGCIESDGNCKEWAESKGCPIYKCARQNKVQFCGLCADFPCKDLKEKISWNPNIVEHLTNLAKLYYKNK